MMTEEAQAKRERRLKDKTKEYIKTLRDKTDEIQHNGYLMYCLPRPIVDEVSKTMNKECPLDFICVQEKLGTDSDVDAIDAYLITRKDIDPIKKNKLAEEFRAIIKKEFTDK